MTSRFPASLFCLAGAVAVALTTLGAADFPQFKPVVLPQLPAAGASNPVINTLTKAPKGTQTFQGVPFQIEQPLSLAGIEDAQQGRMFPPQILNIAVGRKVSRVHLLHACDGSERDGVPLASVVLHYLNGEQRALRLAYGIHGRSLVPIKGEPSLELYDGDSSMAWIGVNRTSPRGQATNRWFQSALGNPMPDEPITSIDLVSLFPRATWSLLAMTLEDGTRVREIEPSPKSRRVVRRAYEFDDSAYRREMVVRALDAASGQPLTNATASLSVTDPESTYYFGRVYADSTGNLRLVYPPQQTVGLTILVRAPGRLPFVHASTNVFAGGIPDRMTASLALGQRIGGIVRSVGGEVVSNAAVTIYHLREDGPRLYTRLDFDTVLTDASGRWSSAAAPAGLEGFQFQITHPEFRPAVVTLVSSTGSPRQGQWKPDDLVASTATATLVPALRLAGKVADNSDKPVSGAEIKLMGSRSSEAGAGGEIVTSTDSEGRFRISVPDPGQYTLLVQADGHAPKMQTVGLKASDAEPLSVTLTSQRKMLGRVNDQDQQPIAGAKVRLESWNDTQHIKFEAETDDKGQFIWENPPEGSLRFYVSATNHSSTTYSISGSPGEQRFTLRRLSRVTGLVVDAETKKPVEEFVVYRGRAYNPGEPIRWERYNPYRGRRGEYSVRLVEYSSSGRTAILVEAPGYMPVASQQFTKAGSYTNNFELQKARGLAGKVVNHAGAPVVGASVVLVDPGENVYMERSGELRRSSDGGAFVRSDREGKFELPPKLEPHTLLAAHADGFAELRISNFLATGVIKLEPWARIQGALKVGLKSDRPPEVRLQNTFYRYSDSTRESQPLSLYVSAQVGPEGEFVFPRVPPGERRVALNYTVRIGNSSRSAISHAISMVLRPGESTNVTIGGTGRLVKGRVKVLGGDEDAVDWKRDFHTLNPVRELKMNIPPPDMSGARTPEQQQAIWAKQRILENEFWRTEAGRAYERSQTPFVLQFETNGMFQIESVPPGKYRLSITPTDPSRDDYSYEQIGSLDREVVVPEGNAGEPFDLGNLEISVRGSIRIGKRAPQFEVPTFDGKPIKLTDYVGKYVLIDFWATWAGTRTLDLQVLKALHESYANDDRLVMIGINFDNSRAQAEEALKTTPLKWTQCFGGMWGDSPLRNLFGLRGLPDALLIDPEGRIAAMNQRGTTIRRTVERILGPPKSPGAGK